MFRRKGDLGHRGLNVRTGFAGSGTGDTIPHVLPRGNGFDKYLGVSRQNGGSTRLSLFKLEENTTKGIWEPSGEQLAPAE